MRGMSSSETGNPIEAVRCWWDAWQSKDRATLARMALAYYVEYAGAGQTRTIGADRLLEVAERFFGRATNTAWSIDDLEVREAVDVAVCSYTWTERGIRDGAAFEAQGLATDVIVRRERHWRYQAHRVTLFESPS